MAHGRAVENPEKVAAGLIERGITGADLARNPDTDVFFAALLQQELDFRNEQIAKGKKPAKSGFFTGSGEFVKDFGAAQAEIRREFIDAEVERLFGPQNVTSSTTPGGVGRVPTAAQLTEIEGRFRSPLELSLAHQQFVTSVAKGAKPETKTPPPTLISGQRQQARRRPRRSDLAAPTILTGDAQSGRSLGGSTILG